MDVLLAAATPAADGAGSGPIWIALIGLASVAVGALIPELFKRMRPRDLPPPPPVCITPEAFRRLEDRLDGVVRDVGQLRGAQKSMGHELKTVRSVMESRDADHGRQLEGVRDTIQRHLWRDHAHDPRMGPPSDPGIPVPRQPEPA